MVTGKIAKFIRHLWNSYCIRAFKKYDTKDGIKKIAKVFDETIKEVLTPFKEALDNFTLK